MLLYCKCFMSRPGKGAQAKVVPSGAAVAACVREPKQMRQHGAEHKVVSMGVAVGVEHKAASHARVLSLSLLILD